MRFNTSLNLVSSLFRRHPLSGIALLILTCLLLFLFISFAYDQLQPPVFILFSPEELDPTVSNTTPYNLEEIMQFD